MTLPQFVVGLRIGETQPKEVTRTLIDAIQEIEINQSDGEGLGFRPGFQILFAAQRSADQRPEYALLQDPLLQPGNRVIVTMTLRAKPRVLIDGIITHQQLTFSSGNGDASLAVMGRDLTLLLDLEEKAVSHKQMKHKEVVETILKGYAKWGIKADVKTPAAAWPQQPLDHGPFQLGTDLAYLRELAAVNGCIFYLVPGPKPGQSVAHWGPPFRTGESQPALTVNMGTATNVEHLHFAYDALAPTQIVSGVTDANSDKVEAIHISDAKNPQPFAQKAAFSANNKLIRTRRMAYAGDDLIEARARAQADAERSTDHVAVVSGALDATVYGEILTAPGIVGVRGSGVQYDGDYYVKSVKHRITLAAYKQEFYLTREGIGSTKRQVTV